MSTQYYFGSNHIFDDRKGGLQTITARGTLNVIQEKGIGIMYNQSNGTATVITDIDTYFPVAGVFTIGDEAENFIVETGGKLTYKGVIRKKFQVTLSITVTTGTSNQDLLFAVGVNDVVSDDYRTCINSGAGSKACNAVVTSIVEMSTDDYLQVFVANETSDANVTMQRCTVNCVSIN
jgi:hypothetical protein